MDRKILIMVSYVTIVLGGEDLTFCMAKQDGYHSDPNSCSHYYYCDTFLGLQTYDQCATGEVWSQLDELCITNDGRCVTSATTEEQSEMTTRFATEGQSTKFETTQQQKQTTSVMQKQSTSPITSTLEKTPTTVVAHERSSNSGTTFPQETTSTAFSVKKTTSAFSYITTLDVLTSKVQSSTVTQDEDHGRKASTCSESNVISERFNLTRGHFQRSAETVNISVPTMAQCMLMCVNKIQEGASQTCQAFNFCTQREYGVCQVLFEIKNVTEGLEEDGSCIFGHR